MRQRVVSCYPHPTHYRGLLRLTPGENLVDVDVWDQLRVEDPRIAGALSKDLLADGGLYVDFIEASIREYAIEDPTLGDFSIEQVMTDEADTLAQRFAGETGILRALLAKAERGGVVAAFRTVLGEV